eukprot:GHVP01025274.1.p1 GENE.GHVP01025274.1~~GHVP01025274.1.p1  ORF type:complete len:132 (-),score=11.38 GHVP01025274.1:601-996(-)
MQRKVVPLFGRPDRLLTDRGSAFISEPFQIYLKEIRTEWNPTTAYYSQGNIVCETSLRLILHGIKTWGEASLDTKFEEVLQDCVLAHNSSPNETTNETPNYLLTGTDISLPGLGKLLSRLGEKSRLTALRA